MTSEGTKKRAFRIADDIWLPAVAEAKRREETMSGAVRGFLSDYAARIDRRAGSGENR